MILGNVFAHITSEEIVRILLVWVLRYSKDKDKSDDKGEPFSLVAWLKNWFLKKNDNIVAHVLVSFSSLYIGVSNLQAWLGEKVDFPEGVDHIGAAFIIGFIGSYLAEILKKAL